MLSLKQYIIIIFTVSIVKQVIAPLRQSVRILTVSINIVFKNVKFPVTIRWSKGTDIEAGCGQLVVKTEMDNDEYKPKRFN